MESGASTGTGDVGNDLSGTARDVVMARDVSGGIHFHAAKPPPSTVPRQLPRGLFGFTNRVRELAAIDEIAERAGVDGVCPVVVLKGTPGVGKSSLAVRWAHGAAPRFPDGQLYLDLRGYDEQARPVPVEAALASLLRGVGIEGASVPPMLDDRAALYRSMMAGTRRLVFLDNAVSVAQIRPLLPPASECFVLVTSRDELRGIGALEGARKVTVDLLPEAEAVALLRTVAGAGRTSDDAASLAELADLCARLPLALRIAGERLASRPQVSVEQFVGELERERRRLDGLEGHGEFGNVRTVFSWSYRGLPASVAEAFRALGLHPGPSFTEEVVAVLSGHSPATARGYLDVLASAHLVQEIGRGRYAFHDLLRDYAAYLQEEVDGANRGRVAVRRVATWYYDTLGAAIAAMGIDSLTLPEPDDASCADRARRFPGYEEAHAWYEAERFCLAATVSAVHEQGHDDLAWRMAGMLLGVYEVTLEIDDWMETSHIGLQSARRAGDRFGEAVMLESLGKACRATHQLDVAEQYQSEALAIREAIGDTAGQIRSVNALGLVYRRAGRADEARQCFRRVRELAVSASDQRFEAFAALNLGGVDVETGRYGPAVDELNLALRLLRATGQRIYEVDALNDLSLAFIAQGRLSEGMHAAVTAVDTASVLGNKLFLATALTGLARASRSTGDPRSAVGHLTVVVDLHRRLGDLNREALTLDELGETYAEIGDPESAASVHQGAAELHRRLGDIRLEALSLERSAAARGGRNPGV